MTKATAFSIWSVILDPRTGTLVGGALVLTIGAFLGFGAAGKVAYLTAPASWPVTDAASLRVEIDEIVNYGARSPSRRTSYEIKVRYTYEAAGAAHTSEKLFRSGRFLVGDGRDAQRIQGQLYAYDPLPVRYNPADPAEAVLLTEVSVTRWVETCWLAVLVLLIGGAMVFGPLFGRAPRGRVRVSRIVTTTIRPIASASHADDAPVPFTDGTDPRRRPSSR